MQRYLKIVCQDSPDNFILPQIDESFEAEDERIKFLET